MPRLNVILLDRPADITSGYRVAFWADVPVARQRYYANANAKSVWLDATATDNTNLQNGSVAERVIEHTIPSGATLTQIETLLQSVWTDYQNFITNYNPWLHYGSTWDGTTWVITTGA